MHLVTTVYCTTQKPLRKGSIQNRCSCVFPQPYSGGCLLVFSFKKLIRLSPQIVKKQPLCWYPMQDSRAPGSTENLPGPGQAEHPSTITEWLRILGQLSKYWLRILGQCVKPSTMKLPKWYTYLSQLCELLIHSAGKEEILPIPVPTNDVNWHCSDSWCPVPHQGEHTGKLRPVQEIPKEIHQEAEGRQPAFSVSRSHRSHDWSLRGENGAG